MKYTKSFVLKTLLISCILLLNSPGMCYSQDKNTRQNLYPRLKPPVVLIVNYFKVILRNGNKTIQSAKGQPSIGTGFILTPDGYIVTNGHVVQWYNDEIEKPKIKEIQNIFKKNKNQFPNANLIIQKDVFVYLSNGSEYFAEVKKYSPPIRSLTGKMSLTNADTSVNIESGKDVAILKIEGKNLPTVRLGNSENVQGGDPVYIAGFPGVVLENAVLSKKTIFDPTVNQGSISGAKQVIQGTPIIQTDTSITHGNSGGPAFNSKGEVIGIATLGSADQKGQEIQGFNFLVPINTAKEFIRVSGAELNQESLFNTFWNNALDAYSNSDFKTARSMIDEANRVIPNIPDVKKLEEKLMDPNLIKKDALTVPLILGILGAALIGGVVLFFFRSRGKKSPLLSSTPTIAVATKTKAAIPSAFLKCSEGPLAGRTFPITAEGVKIGRDPVKNQIVIDNDGISREHASFVIENEKVVIRDLNSLNGTFIGSTDTDRIKSEVLKNGDVVIIGKGKFATFTFCEG